MNIALLVYSNFWPVFLTCFSCYICRLNGVSLQTAVPRGGHQSVNAFGVESCACPAEYESLSCQDPVGGYYRRRPLDFMGSSDVLDLVGLSVMCQCNGHSRECDRQSGVCRVSISPRSVTASQGSVAWVYHRGVWPPVRGLSREYITVGSVTASQGSVAWVYHRGSWISMTMNFISQSSDILNNLCVVCKTMIK